MADRAHELRVALAEAAGMIEAYAWPPTTTSRSAVARFRELAGVEEPDDPPMVCTSKIRHVCHRNNPDCYFEPVKDGD